MEQLSREALQLLMERTGAIEARAGNPGTALWARRESVQQPHVSTVAPQYGSAGGQPAARDDGADEGLLMPIGIERRLVRRAEARWESMRRNDTLPQASAAGALLAPPFANRAMLISFPTLGAGSDDPGAMARFSHVGEALPALCAVPDGPVAADASPSAPLASRLVALAESALRNGAVRHLDSDEDGAGGPAYGARPQLLLRAIALPLALARNGVSTAVVIASWRKLLSPDETAALHQELAAAVAWMHDHGPQA